MPGGRILMNEKAVSNDYTSEEFNQVDMEIVNNDINEWLMKDNRVYKDIFKEVTREEEFKAVQETISDVMIER